MRITAVRWAQPALCHKHAAHAPRRHVRHPASYVAQQIACCLLNHVRMQARLHLPNCAARQHTKKDQHCAQCNSDFESHPYERLAHAASKSGTRAATGATCCQYTAPRREPAPSPKQTTPLGCHAAMCRATLKPTTRCGASRSS